MNKIGIVTVLYNSAKVLPDFFQSLESQTFKDFTLYIIDNNSLDNSLEIAQVLAKGVAFKCVIFPEKENWGVARGNNIGIKAALKDDCKYILLSNNDIVIREKDALYILYSKMISSSIDIIVPKIYYYSPHNIIWAAGGRYKRFDTLTEHIGCNEIDHGQYNQEMLISYTPTCFALIRNRIFNSIGFMDERYFVYYDDTDFMYRALKSGHKIMYTPATSILHKESTCTGKESPFSIYYLTRNQLLFIKKFHSPIKYYVSLGIKWFTHFFKHSLTFNKELYEAECKGIIDGMKLK